MTFDKEILFKSRLPEAEVEVSGIGVIRVRALSRAEAMTIQQLQGLDVIERKILSLALIDPKLTEQEIKLWQDASIAGELECVTDKVAELSGMNRNTVKETYQNFDNDPMSQFRSLPSGETSQNG